MSLTLSDDRPGCVTRHPVAGAGPHGGGVVVLVVDGAAVDVVVEVEDELLLEDVAVELPVVDVPVVELVVDAVLLVDVVLLLVLVLLVDVLVVLVVVLVLVVDELVVVDVVLVVDVVDVAVLVEVVPPISQFVPLMPVGQMQTYAPASVARHVPPFRHGLFG